MSEAMGHNLPPSEVEAYADTLKEKTKPIEAIIDDYVVGLKRLPEEIDDENAGQVTDFIKSCRALYKKAETMRTDERKHYEEFRDAAQKHFVRLTSKLAELGKAATARLDVYQQAKEAAMKAAAEEERKRAEEAERLAREEAAELQRKADEAAKAADTSAAREKAKEAERRAREAEERADKEAERKKEADKAPETTTRGGYGASAGTTKRWTFEVEDIAKVPRQFLMVNTVAVNDAIKADAKAMKEGKEGAAMRTIAGLRIFQKSSTVVR